MTLFQEKSSKTEDPFLDTDLAVLVARCLSDKVATQPQLSELAAKASSAIQNRNWEHYSRRQFESDNWIREKLNRFLQWRPSLAEMLERGILKGSIEVVR